MCWCSLLVVDICYYYERTDACCSDADVETAAGGGIFVLGATARFDGDSICKQDYFDACFVLIKSTSETIRMQAKLKLLMRKQNFLIFRGWKPMNCESQLLKKVPAQRQVVNDNQIFLSPNID